MKISAGIFLAYFLLLFYCADSQEKIAQHFTINNGLPGSSIRCIFKDSRGFIWLGTDAGVSRFNGSEFKNYSSKDGLANDKVWSITEDDENNLIFGCYGGGISFFNGKKFKSITEKDSLKTLFIRNLFFDKISKTLYAGAQDGLVIFYKDGTRKEVSRQLKNAEMELLIGGIFLKAKDTLFVSTLTKGNYYMDLKTIRMTPVDINDSLCKLHGYSMYSDNEEKIFTAAEGIISYKNGKTILYPYPKEMAQPTWGLTKQNDTSYYMVSWGGGDGNSYGDILHFNGTRYVKCKAALGINGVKFWSIYYDKNSGKLFIGTLDDGLFVASLNDIKYQSTELNKESNTFIYTLDDEGTEWIVTPKELRKGTLKITTKLFSDYVIDRTRKNASATLKAFKDPKSTYQTFENLIREGLYSYKNPFLDHKLQKMVKIDSVIASNQIRHYNLIIENWQKNTIGLHSYMSFGNVFQDAKKNHWLTSSLGLFKIDPGTLNPLGYYDVGCFQFVGFDSYKRAWCRQEYSLLNMIPDMNEPLKFYTFKREKKYRVPTDIYVMVEGLNGDVWFGTSNQGLFRYRDKVFKGFIRSNSFLQTNDVSALCFTKDKRLIVGQPNGDLTFCSVKDSLEPLLKLTNKSGYEGTSIYYVKEDEAGNIVFVTNKAIVKFKYQHWLKTKELIFQNINESDGFVLKTEPSAFNYKNSEILYLIDGNKKITINTNKLDQFEYTVDTLYIENIRVNYSNINWDSLYQLKNWTHLPAEIKLSHEQNFLEIYFNSINVAAANKDLFRYKMEGLDNQWSPFSNIKKALFTSLPPGKYIFKVQCYNPFRKNNIRECKIEITITPPWWKTTAFYFIISVLVFLLIILIIKYRERQLKERQLHLENQVQQRTTEVVQQKSIIEEKQKEIVDSINYAKRIQNTLMAHEDFLNKHLPEHFVFFKPKDIVSGDFFWAEERDGKFYFAVCDSTGHGVPGAFMSLLNINFLNEAINEKLINEPHEILNFVRKRLIENISKEGQKDGFDGILICIDSLNNKITYSAANCYPVLIRGGVSMEMKNDRMPVGLGERSESFNLHEVHIKKGDLIYLFTDGYSDQFGGLKGKKYKSKSLLKLLTDNFHLSMYEQKEIIEKEFEKWKGSLEQVDDVTVVGLRF